MKERTNKHKNKARDDETSQCTHIGLLHEHAEKYR